MDEENKRIWDLENKYKKFNFKDSAFNNEKKKTDLDYQEFLEWKNNRDIGKENEQEGEIIDLELIKIRWFIILTFVVIVNVLVGLFESLMWDVTNHHHNPIIEYIIQFIVNITFLVYSTNILIDSRFDIQKSRYIKIFFIHIFTVVLYLVGMLSFREMDGLSSGLIGLSILILLTLSLIISWFKIYKSKYYKIEYFITPFSIIMIPLIVKLIIWIV